MNELRRTRESLHTVAEWLLAGPQLAASDTVRLRIVPGGIATVAQPNIAIQGASLVYAGIAHPINGQLIESLAEKMGISAQSPAKAYSPSTPENLTTLLEVNDEAASFIMRCYQSGHQALTTFCAGETPVLWPEHFDVAITWDTVNFGVSPGDSFFPEPYAYVGPWTPQSGEFWNAPFGSFRPMSDLASPNHIVQFFTEGRRRAQES